MGVTTVPEALKGMYGPKNSLAISCVMAGVIWGILTLETQGVGIVIATMTGWGIVQGAIVGGILGIFYVILAGMEEVGVVNVINAP
jgi:SSS family solute:Na+ symporter